MHRNGTVAEAPPPRAGQAGLGAALLRAEQTGVLDPALWPALRELLISSSDPAVAAATGPLRTLVQARAHYEAAYQAVAAQLGQFPPATDVGAVGAASEALALAMEELTGRAQAVVRAQSPAGLEGTR